MRLIIEFWSAKLGCIVDQIGFSISSSEILEDLLGIDGIDGTRAYELEVDNIKILESIIQQSLPRHHLKPILRTHIWLDDLSYPTHTGRELVLMLEGLKPLAAFVGSYPPVAENDDIPETYFQPFVNAGRFISREFIQPSKNKENLNLRHVLYALPNHQWRLDAYILMLRTSAIEGWSNAFERLQGSLLGYEDWQNDEFMNLRATHSILQT